MSLYHLSRATALGYDALFPCPLPIPADIIQSLELVTISYYGFDGQMNDGQLVIHHELVGDIRHVFHQLWKAHFPIASMLPIAVFDWNDEWSMAANNTSGFCYRYIAGSNPPRLSSHSLGRAIDINPWHNPCCSHGVWSPTGARYDTAQTGTLSEDSLPVRLFLERGWIWGGHWREPFDPQHFQKL